MASNNLKWLTHDTDAHEDKFIDGAIEKFGPFGYMAYFVILELLAKEGDGDILTIQVPRLCKKLRCRSKQLVEFLDYCSTKDELKVNYSSTKDQLKSNYSSTSVQLQNKKFNERCKKMKMRGFFERKSVRVEKEIEREIEKETSLVASPQKKVRNSSPKVVPVRVPVTDVAVVPAKPKELTAQQKLIRYFKEAKGVNANDTAWDRKHWNGRLGKEANAVLKAFDGDIKKAGEYILIKGEEWQHLPDWGLNGIVAAAGRDPRLVGGEDAENGHKDGALDADSRDGSGRVGWTSPSRALAGDALRALTDAAIRKQEPPDVGRIQPNIRIDENKVS